MAFKHYFVILKKTYKTDTSVCFLKEIKTHFENLV